MVTTPIYGIDLPDPGSDEDKWAPILNAGIISLEERTEAARTTGASAQTSANAAQADIDAHEARQDNPHAVTAAQVGAVRIGGDTMTGALTLPGDPTQPLHAATKGYVDGAISGGGLTETVADTLYVRLDGTHPMTGALTLPGAPVNPLHAASKGYVDSLHDTSMNAIGVVDQKAVDAQSDIDAHVANTSNPHSVTAAQVGALSQADADARYVNLTGDTMTGVLTVPAGSAAAPGLTFAGDPVDTGLYRPTADAVGIATGGVERMRISTLDHTIYARRVSIREVTPASGVVVRLDAGVGGYNAQLEYLRNAVARWWFYMGNSVADVGDGSNAGSDLTIRRHSDAGASLGDMVMFQRSTGQTRFSTTGTNASPTIGLGNGSNAGINWPGGSAMDFITNSALRMSLTTAALNLSVPLAVSHNNSAGNTITQSGAGTGLDIQQTGTGKGLIVTCAGASAGDPFTVEDSTRPDATPFIVKNDGKVGIGTTAPTVELDVVGQIKASGNIEAGPAIVANGSANFNADVSVAVPAGRWSFYADRLTGGAGIYDVTADREHLSLNQNGNSNFHGNITVAPQGNLDASVSLIATAGNWTLACEASSGAMYFYSSILDATAALLLPNGSLRVTNTVEASGSTGGLRCQNVGTIGADGFSNAIGFGWDGTLRARVDGTQLGSIQFQASDPRLKQGMTPLPPTLPSLLSLGVYSFTWDYPEQHRDVLTKHGTVDVGVNADEVAPLFPHVMGEVQYGPDEPVYKTVNYVAMVPLLLAAIKEQQQQIETLAARVAALEAAQ